MRQLTYLNISHDGRLMDDLWLGLSAIEDTDEVDDTVLTQREKRIYQKFDNNRRKKEFVGARSVLHNLARDAGMDMETFQLKKTKQGRPYGVTQSETMHVSIAHTDYHVLCGLSTGPTIGVDLEPVDRRIHKGLRERLLVESERENQRLNTIETLRIWTIKEAVVKLTGDGLSELLSEMAIDQLKSELFTASVNGYQNIHIHSWKHQKYWIAVAIFVE